MTISVAVEQTISSKLLMGQPAPALEVNTLAGGTWKLTDQVPANYTMIVFYRGLHCPICEQYITDLDGKMANFKQLGIEVIAISGDSLERATEFQKKASIQNVTIGYGLTPAEMRQWGLYLSKGHFETEPQLFSEPAVFLVKPDGHLYFANIGTHPFSRVDFGFLLRGLEYIIPRNYPCRGTEL